MTDRLPAAQFEEICKGKTRPTVRPGLWRTRIAFQRESRWRSELASMSSTSQMFWKERNQE